MTAQQKPESIYLYTALMGARNKSGKLFRLFITYLPASIKYHGSIMRPKEDVSKEIVSFRIVTIITIKSYIRE